MENKHKIFITGGAGYIGAMIARSFATKDSISEILCLDKEPKPELLDGIAKIKFIQANLGDNNWQEEVKKFSPDIIINTAWQIREMYGKKALQWKWNVTGSDNVFDLAFSIPSVKKLIHFSTVASYAAYPENTLEHKFTEDESFRESDYLYAIEKKVSEDHLKEKFDLAKDNGFVPQVFIVRPAAITGPRGRYMRVRFGLQSALSGQLNKSKNFFYRLVSLLTSFVPATPKWCRQFIHEDDVNDIIELLAINDLKGEYEVFNICPPGDPVLADDMAKAVGKKVLRVSPQLIRFMFFIMRNISFGVIPTSVGGWKSYSYPIVVDGSKLTRMYGYQYKYSSKDAFVKKEGRYMKFVNEDRV